ncbi:uncharacterized protein LOC129589344 [Paramacrobiotus metropolitanus]|uniref:uncharacterized protein LOC129589344 n=1 Tax=Paramacrobiotus metropolitanus TaxID=2943436 RepID=UPI0024463010|nr:uncharacterized protein LOC129589344 [Paramacrobiotus metropolitanus]
MQSPSDPHHQESTVAHAARPAEPPPYPGRSVIINYDLDDPEHWKNKLDKLHIPAAAARRSVANGHCPPATPVTDNQRVRSSSPSPVATGAVLTLAELKRKQMHKRRARLQLQTGTATAASGNGQRNEDDNSSWCSEEDVDSAEASLELRLRRILAKENISMEDYYNMNTGLLNVRAVPASPSPDMQQLEPNVLYHRLSDLCSYDGPYLPKRHATLDTGQRDGKPPLRLRSPNRNKCQFYDLKTSPAVPTRSGHNRRILTDVEFRETFDNSSRAPMSKESKQSEVHRNFAGSRKPTVPSSTPPSTPFSPVNCPSESHSPADEAGFWDQPALSSHEKHSSHNDYAGSNSTDGDLDSTGGDHRASSDEGFSGNLQEDDANLYEYLAKKQVLALCDMQMKLLQAMSSHKPTPLIRSSPSTENIAISPQHAHVHTQAQTSLEAVARSRNESPHDVDMQRRCEMLEGHISKLTQNIEYLTNEIEAQQASLRHLELNQRPRVRFADEKPPTHSLQPSVQPLPVVYRSTTDLSQNGNSDSLPTPVALSSRPANIGAVITVPQSKGASDNTHMLSNPERVNKLTKFFGSEPPLVRIFLKKLGYEKYARLFEIERIGLNELPYMTEDKLRRLGVPMGPRTRILHEAQLIMKSERNPHTGFV